MSVFLMCCSQHDAHEFLIYLLEGLHEDVNWVQVKKKRILDADSEVEYIRYEIQRLNSVADTVHVDV